MCETFSRLNPAERLKVRPKLPQSFSRIQSKMESKVEDISGSPEAIATPDLASAGTNSASVGMDPSLIEGEGGEDEGQPSPQKRQRTNKAKEKRERTAARSTIVEETKELRCMYPSNVEMNNRISAEGVTLLAYESCRIHQSWVWTYFKRIEEYHTFAGCNLCHAFAIANEDDLSVQWAVMYGKLKSTGKLKRHLSVYHKEVFKTHAHKVATAGLKRKNGQQQG
jgi:hypothetical protein